MNSPEVRQCVDSDDEQFGAVAVRAGENRWGVMNPGVVNPNRVGGHWGDDNEVEGWTVLVAPPAPVEPTPATEEVQA